MQPAQCADFLGYRARRGQKLSIPISRFDASLDAYDLKLSLSSAGCFGVAVAPEEFIVQLEGVAGTPSSLHYANEAVWIEAVGLLRRGVSKADVARRFGVSDEAVRKWWKRYEDQHDHGCWSRHPRSGTALTQLSHGEVSQLRCALMSVEAPDPLGRAHVGRRFHRHCNHGASRA